MRQGDWGVEHKIICPSEQVALLHLNGVDAGLLDLDGLLRERAKEDTDQLYLSHSIHCLRGRYAWHSFHFLRCRRSAYCCWNHCWSDLRPHRLCVPDQDRLHRLWRDAVRLVGDLHDRRRRPHVPSQDKMGDGWLRKCWCLDLLSLHHLRHTAYDGRKTQIQSQPRGVHLCRFEHLP